jgi:hypothetical protein
MIRVGGAEFVSNQNHPLRIPVVFDDPSVNWGFSCHKIFLDVYDCLWCPPTWLLPPDTYPLPKPVVVASPWRYRAHARVLRAFSEENKLN